MKFNKQKNSGFVGILVLIIIVAVVSSGGVYVFQKQKAKTDVTSNYNYPATSATKVETDVNTSTKITPSDTSVKIDNEGSSITVLSVTKSEIVFSNNKKISINDFPDEVQVSVDSKFGTSDRITDAKLSPDAKWLAITIGGAAHDFGWIYNLESKKLSPVAFSYGGGVNIKDWKTSSEVVFKITTAKPEILEKTVNVYSLPRYPTAETGVKNSIPGRYNGSKYSFSYPSDWVAFEANSSIGFMMLYPESKSIEFVRKTLPTTSSINISLVPAKSVDLSGTKTVVIDGITWYIKNYGKTDGGTENGIEYMRMFNNDSYVVLFTGVSNRVILEAVVSSFLAG